MTESYMYNNTFRHLQAYYNYVIFTEPPPHTQKKEKKKKKL